MSKCSPDAFAMAGRTETPMNVVAVVQHTSGEYLGLMEDHLEGRGIRFRYLRPAIDPAWQDKAAQSADGLVILPGKMVYEVRSKGCDKGVAVRAFLEEAPFKGRMPVYMGDDVTDEDAFAVVNALGGISIKIDDGDSEAQYRTDREGLFAWLAGLAEKA